MIDLIQSGTGISIFGLFSMNPAMFVFVLTGLLFGGLNLLEFKRFD